MTETSGRLVHGLAKFFAEFYERVVALKAKGVKVLVAIGGWNDSAGDKYSRLVNSASARRRFVENVLAFIEKYEFDGLDLDWEYPVCWQVQYPGTSAFGTNPFLLALGEIPMATNDSIHANEIVGGLQKGASFGQGGIRQFGQRVERSVPAERIALVRGSFAEQARHRRGLRRAHLGEIHGLDIRDDVRLSRSMG